MLCKPITSAATCKISFYITFIVADVCRIWHFTGGRLDVKVTLAALFMCQNVVVLIINATSYCTWPAWKLFSYSIFDSAQTRSCLKKDAPQCNSSSKQILIVHRKIDVDNLLTTEIDFQYSNAQGETKKLEFTSQILTNHISTNKRLNVVMNTALYI